MIISLQKTKFPYGDLKQEDIKDIKTKTLMLDNIVDFEIVSKATRFVTPEGKQYFDITNEAYKSICDSCNNGQLLNEFYSEDLREMPKYKEYIGKDSSETISLHYDLFYFTRIINGETIKCGILKPSYYNLYLMNDEGKTISRY